jgi:hypothetical protein
MAHMVRDLTKQWTRGAPSLLSATIAAAAVVSASPALSAQTTQDTCGVTAHVPVYQNGRVSGQGVAWCHTPKDGIGVAVQLTRDGTLVGESRDTCANAKTCHETASAPNRQGNQRWCLHVYSVGQPGGHQVACENRGF